MTEISTPVIEPAMIDEMIVSKRQLSDDLLDGGGSGELNLTELADEDLLRLVSLDLHTASAET